MFAGQGGTLSGSSCFLVLFCALSLTTGATAAVTSTTQHGAGVNDFNGLLSDSDLIQGKATEGVDVFTNPVDSFGNPSLPGWHTFNVDPLDQLAAFTDGIGIRPTNLTGLLNDNFPVEEASGRTAKIVEYPFDTPVDIGRINILTGNNNNADGRIFSTTYIEYSTDGGFSYSELGYFQSDPSGTVNNEGLPLEDQRKSTFVSIFDDASATMLSGVTNLIFNLYSVDNSGGQMRDPFDGVNPITGLDDTLSAAFVSPLVLEIDVLAPGDDLIGDYNGDGSVDAADYVVWRKTGIDGQQGYDNWRTNFGATAGAGASAGSDSAVPEPGGLALLFTAAGISLLRRRRRSG